MTPESLQTYMGGFIHAKYEYQNLEYHGAQSSETFAFFAIFSKTVPKHPEKRSFFPPFGHSEDATPQIDLIFLKKSLELNLVICAFLAQTGRGGPDFLWPSRTPFLGSST